MQPSSSNRSRPRRKPWRRAHLLGWAASTLIVFVAPGVAASSDVTISPSVAGLFVGEQKVVEGPVTAAQRDGNVVRLRCGTPPQDLSVALVIGLLSEFPPEPERYYLGKTVRVAGQIRSFRRRAEMVIRDPANIRVVDEVASPRQGAPHPQSPETLDERVRRLEERLERLERPGGAGRED